MKCGDCKYWKKLHEFDCDGKIWLGRCKNLAVNVDEVNRTQQCSIGEEGEYEPDVRQE